MPVHDWSKVDANLFHQFHQSWAIEIQRALDGLLPRGYSALVEQHSPQFIPDVLAVERRRKPKRPRRLSEGTATLARPDTRFSEKRKEKSLAARANRVAIHHSLGDIVCVLEIVSPGNKRGRKALADFVEKTQNFLAAGIHVVLIDILAPNKLAPAGIHPLIWEDEHDPAFDPTPAEPLTLAAYRAEEPHTEDVAEAFLERFAVGGRLPDMPAYIEPDLFVNVPLEETYMRAWNFCPKDMRYYVEHGKLPDDEDEG